MLTQTVKDQMVAQVEKFILLARSQYRIEFPIPEVQFKPLGRAAGMAHTGFNPYERSLSGIRIWKVSFDPAITLHNVDEAVNNTAIHEVAHLIDQYIQHIEGKRYGEGNRSIHGPSWKRIMRRFGISDPQRCMRLDLSTVTGVKVKRQERFEYTCNCKVHMVSKTLHNRMRQGNSYTCIHCKSQIVPKQSKEIHVREFGIGLAF